MPVQIDPNIKREAVRIDFNNNQIDPKTKQIIQPAETEYVSPVEQTVPMVHNPDPQRVSLSIAEQIEQAEKHLADLKVQKKAEIERMKAELAKLEADE